MTATIPRPVIALLVAMSLIVEAGCSNKASVGAENGAEWGAALLRGCYAEGCIVSLALAPVFVSVGAVIGAASAELERAEATGVPLRETQPQL